MKYLKLMLLAALGVLPLNVSAQTTTGSGGSVPWLVLTEEYPSSPFNDTTKVQIYYDGSSYNGYATSLQYKIAYDGNALTNIDTIDSDLSSDWFITFNDDTDADQVLVSVVYTGSDVTTDSISDGRIMTLKFMNVHNQLLYSNEQNLSAFTFAGYTAVGSNSNSQDINLGTVNHGGSLTIPHRKFSGFIKDYATDKGIQGMEYQLRRDNSVIQTVLSTDPTVTNAYGYYEMVYYEYFYGYIDDSTTDFDFYFKSEDIDSDNAITTADAYRLFLYANNKLNLRQIELLAGDVNHSHTVTIADAYANYSYNAGTYTGWSTLGEGGYRDVMFVKPEDIKYLETDSLTETNIGIGPLGFAPQEINWLYDLNAYNGITDLTEDFSVVIMGDVNGTSLGGNVGKPKQLLKANQVQVTSVETSVVAKLPDKQVVTGDEFKVDLTLHTKGQDVHSYDFQLDYDPDVLTFIDASTPYLPNSWMLFFNADSLGLIEYGGMDGSGGDFPIRTDTVETIVQFTFKAKSETGVGETPIEFGNKYNTGDREGRDLKTSVIDGKVYMQVVSSIVENPESIPNGFALNQNYPNPFNPTTTIPFTIVSPQEVSLDIYTIDGKFVENLYNKFTSTGYYNLTWDASNLPSGVYVAKLTTDKGFTIKKLTLLK